MGPSIDLLLQINAAFNSRDVNPIWTVTGTGADGERLDYQGCDIYQFRGDQILNKDTYWKLVEQRPRL